MSEGAGVFVAPVLGIPVTIRSASADVLALAESSFGPWRMLREYPALVETVGVELTVDVTTALRGADPVTYELRDGGETLHVRAMGCDGEARRAERRGTVRVGPALLAATEQFRYTVLEAAVLFLLTGPNRYPVHASAVMRGGHAILFAGPSGVGKSTLAWAARAAGWEVLSDDIVYVQHEPSWRAWGGGSARSYFALGAEAFVPELAGMRAELRAGGKVKFALPRGMPMPPATDAVALCLLARGVGAPRVARLAPGPALEALTRWPEPGFDVHGGGKDGRLAPLAARAWQLRTGDVPAAALPLLEEVDRAI